jgi:thiamine biosynthesis lipoprotein
MKKTMLFFSGLLLLLAGEACQESPDGLEAQRYSGYAQGTTYHITLRDSSGAPDRAAAIDSIFKRVDRSMNAWDSSSLVARLNAGDTLQPDPLMRAMIRRAQAVYRHTEGAFDPTVGPLVAFWGFGPEKRRAVDTLRLDSVRRLVGLPRLPSFARPLALPRGMQLDFNAIAQGYTVDLLARHFNQEGLRHYLVEVGGEARTRGRNPDGKVWRLGIDKPTEKIDQQDRFQVIIKLDSASLATSGNYRKFWVDSTTGLRYAHTIDPRTGRPAMSRLLSASVVAPTATTADAYATALMVMGTDGAQRFLDTTSLPLEAYLISAGADSSFQVYQTPGFQEMVLNP